MNTKFSKYAASSKENYAITTADLGRLLRRIFPDVQKVRRTSTDDDNSCGKRIHLYDGISFVDSPTKLTWSDIMKYSPPSWFLCQANESFVEWINVSTDVCNSERVIKEFRIERDLSFKLRVKSIDVNIGQYVRNIVPYKHCFDNLFSFLFNTPLCKGFVVDVDKKTTSRDGTVVGITEKWSTSADQAQLPCIRHRAVDCSVFLTSHQQMCGNCSKIKVNSFYKTLQSQSTEKKSAPQKRETYMTSEEIKDKLQLEKKRRISSERRVQRLRETLETMYTFDNNDCQDFEKMFSNIDVQKLSPDLKLFWQAQKKALETKDSRGNRWHPK